MKIEHLLWTSATGWQGLESSTMHNADLVIFFTPSDTLEENKLPEELRKFYPKARVVGSSSTAEIFGAHAYQMSCVAIAISFEHSFVKVEKIHVDDVNNSYLAGKELIQKLPATGLKHVFLLSDALKLDATQLVEGVVDNLPPSTTLTGGLAGDDVRFEKSYIYCDGEIEKNGAIAVGFYGDRLKINFACEAGWKPYGPERIATKTSNNILYELDGKPALQLYKDFLGRFAERLPSIGLLYPLAVRPANSGMQFARTIVAIDEKTQSITLAGGVPQGSFTQFMMTSASQLINGAEMSAKKVKNSNQDELVLLLSCTARMQVLKQRVDEELEAVQSIFGDNTKLVGFYTYGEISPRGLTQKCHLQNQTMAITTIKEET